MGELVAGSFNLFGLLSTNISTQLTTTGMSTSVSVLAAEASAAQLRKRCPAACLAHVHPRRQTCLHCKLPGKLPPAPCS